ncbi:MAG: response regulator [Rhodothermales bacterium]|nr:response regulator [Rhodothermales bacterium]MBO6781520.1 response regulator [Rhodothermales bacterium]
MLVGLALLASEASGQAFRWAESSYTAVTWTTADGLPIDRINDVVRTPDGYVWAATIEGLVRFDGVRFHTFNGANTPALETSRLTLLHVDKQGTLWIVTERLSVIRYDDYRFEPITIEGKRIRLTGPTPHVSQRIHEDSAGAMWFATPSGAVKVNSDQSVLMSPGSGNEGAVLGIGRAVGGGIWISYEGGTAYLLGVGGTVQRFGGQSGLEGFVSRVFADSLDRTWAAGEEGIFRLSQDVFRPVLASGLPVGRDYHFATTLTNGDPWFGTTGGAAFQLEGDELRYVHHADSIPFVRAPAPGSVFRGYADWQVLADGSTIDVLHNRTPVYSFSGNINNMWSGEANDAWIASDGGLIHLAPAPVSVIDHPDRDSGGGSANVYPLLQDSNGTIWAGHLWYELLRIDAQGIEVWGVENRGVDAGHPWSLYEDSSGRVLVAGTGVCKLHPGPVECPPDDLRPPSIGGIRVMWEDASGRFWLGGETGIALRENGAWQRFGDDTVGISNAWIRAIEEDSNGALWFGTNGGGLLRYRGNSFESFSRSDGFCSDLVRDLFFSPDGALWVATEDRGLCRIANPLDPVSELEIGIVGTPQGLGYDGVHAVTLDAQGRLWMSTNSGIGHARLAELTEVALDPTLGVRYVAYDERDGMRNREANGGVQPASLTARDGTVWFPTQQGLAVVDPAQVKSTPWAPVLIETITAPDTTFYPSDEIRLTAEQTDVAVSYTYPRFRKAEDLAFQYRLLGHSDWIHVGSERIARFSGVPPGETTFQIRIAEGQRGAEESVTSVSIYREPRFRETRWPWLLGFLFAVALGAVGSSARNTRLRRRAERLEQEIQHRTKDLRSALDTVAVQAEELRSLDEAKSRFFANVSHELRTPLTMILGPLRGLLEGRYGGVSPDAGAQLEVMLRNSRRLLRLVNQILDLAELDSGHLAIDAKPHDLCRFVEQLTEAFQGAATSRGLDLTLDSSGPIEVPFDPQHLEVILLNLISNAIKFTAPGGRVQIRLAIRGGNALMEVIDTGDGIAPESLPKVFDRFYQEEGSPGTGIGLALARELARLHGGELTAESEEGRGSTFTVSLPGALSEVTKGTTVPASDPIDLGPNPAARGSSAASETTDDEVPTILVVEDNPDLRAYLTELLEHEYRVLLSADGDEASKLVARVLPDLILSDVMMPGMDGVQLSRSLKTDRMTAHIPVILLTAKASRRDALEGLRAGADDYIAKPFDPEELLARLRNQLRTRKSLRARYQGDSKPILRDMDRSDGGLVAQCEAYVRRRMADPSLTVEGLAEALNLTYSTLNRRLASEAGVKATQLIRRVRLREAATLLEEGAGSVTEVAYGVGFNTLSYFAKCFKDEYGVLPSTHMGTGKRK